MQVDKLYFVLKRCRVDQGTTYLHVPPGRMLEVIALLVGVLDGHGEWSKFTWASGEAPTVPRFVGANGSRWMELDFHFDSASGKLMMYGGIVSAANPRDPIPALRAALLEQEYLLGNSYNQG